MKSGLLAGLYALKAIIGRARRPAVRAAGVHRQPGRGDRLADLDAAHPRRSPRTSTSRSSSSAPAPTATSSRRARASSTCASTVHGRAAHAGVEPEKGRSAILEAARIVARPARLNGRWPGVTVNVGVIAGGTRPNVVAERCALEVDVRGDRPREALEAAEAAIRADRRAATEVPDTTVELDARWRAGGRWRSSSAAAGSSSTPRRVAGRARLRGRRRGDRRRVRRQHDVRDGRPEPRRPRPDRRQRPRARRSTSRSTRSCRGRRCSPACCWPSPRDPEVLAWRATTGRRRRVTRAPADLVGRTVGGRSPATAGRSSSATRAGSPARPTPGRTARRATPATSRPRRGRSSRSSSGARRGGLRPRDVVRTRMFVTDIAAGRGGHRRSTARSSATIRPAATLVEVARARSIRACSSRSRPRRAGADRGRGSGRERGQTGPRRAIATMATARDEPEQQVAPPRDEGQADEDREPLDADVERRRRRRPRP